jgi:hypothetical protein
MMKRYGIDEKARKVANILPLTEDENLQEDLHDLAVIAERSAEPAVSPDELKKQLE